jgi:hypothetical protein
VLPSFWIALYLSSTFSLWGLRVQGYCVSYAIRAKGFVSSFATGEQCPLLLYLSCVLHTFTTSAVCSRSLHVHRCLKRWSWWITMSAPVTWQPVIILENHGNAGQNKQIRVLCTDLPNESRKQKICCDAYEVWLTNIKEYVSMTRRSFRLEELS